eukprot:6199531-Pleurochrysis_carterae.AAC.4
MRAPASRTHPTRLTELPSAVCAAREDLPLRREHDRVLRAGSNAHHPLPDDRVDARRPRHAPTEAAAQLAMPALAARAHDAAQIEEERVRRARRDRHKRRRTRLPRADDTLGHQLIRTAAVAEPAVAAVTKAVTAARGDDQGMVGAAAKRRRALAAELGHGARERLPLSAAVTCEPQAGERRSEAAQLLQSDFVDLNRWHAATMRGLCRL